MVFKDGKLLLGKRKNVHGAGDYAFPGGHLEYMESFEACARREAREEAGIEIENIQFVFLSNIKEYAPRHYVHIGLKAEWKSGEPQNLELEKCEGWGWYDIDDLPQPIFYGSALTLEAYKNEINFKDTEF